MIDKAEGNRMLAALERAVCEAWRVEATQPDLDKRLRRGLGGGSWCLPVVHEAIHAYGASEATAPPSSPPPSEVTRMEAVMVWMAWLRQHEGNQAVRRIMGLAMGVSRADLGDRETPRCTRQTVTNRINRSMAAVLERFLDTVVEIDTPDEPVRDNRTMRGFGEQAQALNTDPELRPSKVWIDGIGFMIYGKAYNPEGQALTRGRHSRRYELKT